MKSHIFWKILPKMCDFPWNVRFSWKLRILVKISQNMRDFHQKVILSLKISPLHGKSHIIWDFNNNFLFKGRFTMISELCVELLSGVLISAVRGGSGPERLGLGKKFYEKRNVWKIILIYSNLSLRIPLKNSCKRV